MIALLEMVLHTSVICVHAIHVLILYMHPIIVHVE